MPAPLDRRRFFLAAAAAAAAAAAVALGAPAQADEAADGARDVVAALLDTVHDALIAGGGDTAARDRSIREAVATAFDLVLWRQAVIGGLDDGLTADQLAEMDAALPGWMAAQYTDTFAGGADRRPEILETGSFRRDARVDVRMYRADADPLPLQYRVRATEAGPRVIDVIVNGVSFALLKREEFRAVVERQGAEVLIAHLKDSAN